MPIPWPTGVILQTMALKPQNARTLQDRFRHCAVWLLLVAILLLTLPASPSSCGSHCAEAPHPHLASPCCNAPQTPRATPAACCSTPSLPALPVTAASGPTQLVLAFLEPNAAPPGDPSYIEQPMHPLPPAAPPPLLRPILRI